MELKRWRAKEILQHKAIGTDIGCEIIHQINLYRIIRVKFDDEILISLQKFENNDWNTQKEYSFGKMHL